MRDEDSAGWVELLADVVEEDGLQFLLGGLGGVIRDLLERAVYWGEDGEIGGCAVQ